MPLGRTDWYPSPERSRILDAVHRATLAREWAASSIHPSAVELLQRHKARLDSFGGADGLIESCEAAAWLTWLMAALEALFVIARGGAR